MITTLFLAFAKIIGLTLLGYLIFSLPNAQGKPRTLFKNLIMNFLIPIYYIYYIPVNWANSVESSMWGVVIAVVGSILFLVGNTLLGKMLAKKLSLREDWKWTFPFLVGIHNSGYIPMPLMISLGAPPVIMTWLFVWITAFNIYFWSYILNRFQEEDAKFTFKINGPLVGLLLGFLIAALNLQTLYPQWIHRGLSFLGDRGMEGVLVLLGAVLAGIDRKRIRFYREFGWMIGLRYLLYPLLIGSVLLLVVLRMDNTTAYSLKLGILIQAFAPPATNLMIVTAITHQKEETLDYTASGIIYAYGASFLIMPALLLLFALLFSL